MTYQEWKSTVKDWKNEPISSTCEVLVGSGFCGEATVKAYPAMGGGWMALCYRHGLKHSEAFSTDQLIAAGETWR